MKLKPADLIAWTKTHEGRKIFRYTMVSVISTAVSFITIAVVYGLKIIPGVLWATLTGNVLAAIPSYYLNRKWAWGKTGKSHFRKEVFPFWFMAFLGILVSQVGAYWARSLIKSHHWKHIIDTGLVTGVNLMSFGIFWVLKMIVFNRIFHPSEIEEFDEHLRAEEVSR